MSALWICYFVIIVLAQLWSLWGRWFILHLSCKSRPRVRFWTKLKSKFFIEKHCQCLSVNFYHFLQSQCWILEIWYARLFCLFALTKSLWIHPDKCTLLLLYRRFLQLHTCTSADSAPQMCLLDTILHSSVHWTLEDSDMFPSQGRRELRSHTCTAACSSLPSVYRHSLKGQRANSVYWIM